MNHRGERIPLDDLALSIRSRNCLHNMGLDTAGQIDDATARDLLGSPNPANEACGRSESSSPA